MEVDFLRQRPAFGNGMGTNRLTRHLHLIGSVGPSPGVDLGLPLVEVLLKAAAGGHVHRQRP